MLERAIKEYKNRGIDTVQAIEELLDLAKKISDLGNMKPLYHSHYLETSFILK